MKERTRKVLIVCGSVVLAGSAFLVFAEQRYGPYFCAACQIATPLPDAATQAFLNEFRPVLEIPFIDRTWIICNASYCADYTPTITENWFEHSYEGRNREKRESGGGGGEGGGRGGSSRGGGGGGGVGRVRGPGEVIVKAPKPV